MAKCPNCDYRLKPWNIKAECPSCSVNIPNFDWENRLNSDAERSEKAFALFGERISNVKNSLFGSKLRIARFVLTFSPLILLLLPFINVTVNLPFIEGEAYISVLSAVLWLVKNPPDFGSLLALLSGEVIGNSILLLLLGTAFFAAAFIVAVISFFLMVIRSFSLGNISNIVCNAISIIFSVGAVIVFSFAFTETTNSGIDFIQEPSLGIALAAAFIFYGINLTINIINEKTISAERKAFLEKRKTIGKLA